MTDKRKTKCAMVSLLQNLDKMFWAGKFEEIDAMLENHDLETTEYLLNLTMLRGTFCVRDKLKNWVPFRERLKSRLEEEGRDSDALLRGLF